LPSPSDASSDQTDEERQKERRKKWSRPRRHCLWWLPTKTQVVFLAILLEDVPQIVISSHVQIKYTDIVTSSALANIVTSAYAVGLKFVQSWIEKSAKEFDVVTTINLANSLRFSGGFKGLIKAKDDAEKKLERAVNGLAFKKEWQECDTQDADSFGQMLDEIYASTPTGDVIFNNGMSDEQVKCLATERMILANGNKTKNSRFSFRAKANYSQKQLMGTGHVVVYCLKVLSISSASRLSPKQFVRLG
jgi:hypothetical protein